MGYNVTHGRIAAPQFNLPASMLMHDPVSDTEVKPTRVSEPHKHELQPYTINMGKTMPHRRRCRPPTILKQQTTEVDEHPALQSKAKNIDEKAPNCISNHDKQDPPTTHFASTVQRHTDTHGCPGNRRG